MTDTHAASGTIEPRITDATGSVRIDPVATERRGRRWIFGSFALCPCHLPLTLAVLATVFGGTALGALLRDHGLLAGLIISAAWLAGTARGLLLVRMAQKGTCPAPAKR
jgi:hypothetical protein